jgi:cob(I)alamin adenosyltransferase
VSIVTRTGDKGETGLFGGQRVSKGDIRIHAYGTVDELNAHLGLILAEKELSAEMATQLLRVQNILFRMGSDLATPLTSKAHVPRMEQQHVKELDRWINAMESSMNMPQYFVLPGGTRLAAQLHCARTICRRAERWTVTLAAGQEINREGMIYLNRLSDYLFLAALQANAEQRVNDVPVSYE